MRRLHTATGPPDTRAPPARPRPAPCPVSQPRPLAPPTGLQLAQAATCAVLVGVVIAVLRPLLLPALALESPAVLKVVGLAGGVVAGLYLASRFGGRGGE